MRPIPKDIATYHIEPGRTLVAGAVLVNLMTYLTERHGKQYDILASIDVSLPEQDFTCDLGVFPPRLTDWQNDLIRVGPPITAFEIVMPTETVESLSNAIRHHYLSNGVKSGWVISSAQRTVHLLHPDKPAGVFTNGLVYDPSTGLEVDIAKVFS